jgi:hypothetical protein
MTDIITWASLILAGGSIVTVLKFWLDMGKQLARVDSAMAIAQAAMARSDIIADNLTKFQLDVAMRYAPSSALTELERDISTKFDGTHTRLDQVNQRLDRMVEAMIHNKQWSHSSS